MLSSASADVTLTSADGLVVTFGTGAGNFGDLLQVSALLDSAATAIRPPMWTAGVVVAKAPGLLSIDSREKTATQSYTVNADKTQLTMIWVGHKPTSDTTVFN
jgi:hypothetical protein